MGIAMDRAGFVKASHNNGRIHNTRATFWIVRGDKLNMTSTDAAKLYCKEHGIPFVKPSDRRADTGGRRSNDGDERQVN